MKVPVHICLNSVTLLNPFLIFLNSAPTQCPFYSCIMLCSDLSQHFSKATLSAWNLCTKFCVLDSPTFMSQIKCYLLINLGHSAYIRYCPIVVNFIIRSSTFSGWLFTLHTDLFLCVYYAFLFIPPLTPQGLD